MHLLAEAKPGSSWVAALLQKEVSQSNIGDHCFSVSINTILIIIFYYFCKVNEFNFYVSHRFQPSDPAICRWSFHPTLPLNTFKKIRKEQSNREMLIRTKWKIHCSTNHKKHCWSGCNNSTTFRDMQISKMVYVNCARQSYKNTNNEPYKTTILITFYLGLFAGSCLLGRLIDWFGCTFMDALGEDRAKGSGVGDFLGIFFPRRLTHFCCSSVELASRSRFFAVEIS